MSDVQTSFLNTNVDEDVVSPLITRSSVPVFATVTDRRPLNVFSCCAEKVMDEGLTVACGWALGGTAVPNTVRPGGWPNELDSTVIAPVKSPAVAEKNRTVNSQLSPTGIGLVVQFSPLMLKAVPKRWKPEITSGSEPTFSTVTV